MLASQAGTAKFAERFPSAQNAQFFRQACGLTVSSLGIGSYLGAMDESTDLGYTGAVVAAVGRGINFIDTSLNYRNQRSERAIGSALKELFAQGVSRESLVLCTKAGYLVPDAVPKAALRPGDVVAGMHSMAPAFLADQLGRSLANLGVDSIDVFYLHNPETQLSHVDADEFYRRAGEAFGFLEETVRQGKIGWYGTATWSGYREAGALALDRLCEAAVRAGGNGHHFRFTQLPYSLAMTEALTARTQSVNGAALSLLDAAAQFGVTAVGSASLMQSRLTRGLPEALAARLGPAVTDAQRAIQFARSAPGLTVALAGMSREEHVAENAGVAAFRPLDGREYAALFESRP